jgi:hypothetical protein
MLLFSQISSSWALASGNNYLKEHTLMGRSDAAPKPDI